MLSHVSLGVADLDQSEIFYDAALAPLGLVRLWRTERGLGYGPPGGDDELALFVQVLEGLEPAEPTTAAPSEAPAPTAPLAELRLAAGPGFHLAFEAPTPEAVDDFHEAALRAGGTDEGAPGPRPRYGPGYHAAFVRDPDGHKLEAVHHG